MSGKRPRIIITGGLGYLGLRLGSFFEQTGNYEVVLTTRRNTNQIPNIPNSFIIKTVDLESELEVASLLGKDDIVIHLAAPNEIDAGKDVSLAINGTIIPTHNLLKQGVETKIKKFIYFSTFHVYGKTQASEITESTLPQPNHPYSISHKAAEDFCLSYLEKQVLDVTVFRLSNSCGAPITHESARWSLVVNDLCKQAVSRNKIALKSYGNQLRDFVTIDHVCNAVQHVITRENKETNGLFNLGGETTISIYDMACLIQSRYEYLTDKKVEIERSENGRAHKFSNFIYSNQKLQGSGFSYQNNLESAIDETLTFCINEKSK